VIIELPLVSIITVVYNGEAHLEQTILSVLNQTYPRIEYILIDGGSTDGTIEIIKRYDSKIDYWVSESDRGIYDAMNKGIAMARGEIIGLINSDDWYEYHAVNRMVEEYLSSSSDIIFGNKRLIDTDLFLDREVSIPVPVKLHDVRLHSVHPTVFVKKSYYQKRSMPFDISYKISADYDFFLKAFQEKATFSKVNIVLANMRVGGISSRFHLEAVKIKRKYFGMVGALMSMLYSMVSLLVKMIVSKNILRCVRLARGWKVTDTDPSTK
jgi:glycosyltransferase involved in cell wall biosynthesis